jgi:hypothetical protein
MALGRGEARSLHADGHRPAFAVLDAQLRVERVTGRSGLRRTKGCLPDLGFSRTTLRRAPRQAQLLACDTRRISVLEASPRQ